MNETIKIRNLTISNLLNLGKPLIFLGFIYYCIFKFGFADSGVLRNFLIFLYVAGFFMTLIFIVYISTAITISTDGVKKTNIFSTINLKWEDVKSINVQVTVANRFTKTLNKNEYFDDFIVGKKEVLISSIEKQLQQSKLKTFNKIIRLPFEPRIIEILKIKELL